MKRLRVFLAAASLASAIVVTGAGPASANCVGEPVDACAVICAVANKSKYLEKVQNICEVW